MLLEVRNVSKIFHSSNGSIEAIRNLNLFVADKEFLCIVGPVGCGKTTLINMIAGFEKPTEGKILFRGEEIKGPGPERIVVFQDDALFPWMTVIQNIEFGLKAQKLPKNEIEKITRRYLSLVGLEEFGHMRPHELSGGMRRKAELARALALNPGVLLMDEPLSSIDACTKQWLQAELLNIWKKEKKTVIYVTHDIDEALFLADRIIVFTARPARVKAEFQIRMSKPRDLLSEEILEVKRKLTSQLVCMSRISPSISRPQVLAEKHSDDS